MNEKNYLLYWFCILIFSIGTIVLLGYLISESIEITKFLSEGKEEQGTIVDINTKKTPDIEIKKADVLITGVDSIVTIEIGNQNLRVGDSVNLKVYGNSIKIISFIGIYESVLLTSCMFLFFLISLLLTIRNKEWILKQGGGYWPYG
ncbi:hypothetical protein LVD17_23780 [Fulvivirga ulvae]|uniref:hypothetical protein n=1 Tax=Fulvivirga ulvae TaxID=2904245 RepID=UPI001F25C122|nr:hypothetical protein [Fulvivirga ulvae]UII31316.1 hypothetical protein LVD17_23780 [Fulvivirga ulvae]